MELVSILRRAGGFAVAGPSKGPDRNRQKREKFHVKNYPGSFIDRGMSNNEWRNSKYFCGSTLDIRYSRTDGIDISELRADVHS